MEIRVQADSNHHKEHKLPLLQYKTLPAIEKTVIQNAISQMFQSMAHLANLLPTGSVLAFQLLSPIFTNGDSFKDKNGNICYGFATMRGLWVIDGSASIPPEFAKKYQLCFIDFVHAFMSILVFAAVALFDQNVVNCFYPTPSDETQETLTALPVGIAVICSMLFVLFPTQCHGIGFPQTSN